MTVDEKLELPGDLAESVLTPVFLRRFSRHVHFVKGELVEQIEKDAEMALEILKGLMPQRESGKFLKVGGL